MRKAASVEQWRSLEKSPEIKDLNTAIQMIHFASQLLALAGKYYGEPHTDDSNTAFRFSCSNEFFTGVSLGIENPLKTGLHLKNFSFLTLDEKDNVIKEFDLNGKSFHEAFVFLKTNLENRGFDTSILKPEMHYQLDKFNFNPDFIFHMPEKNILDFHISLRNNIQVLAKLFTSVFTLTSDFLIWPHHFDSAVLIYPGADKNSSIGIGLAIADEMIPEPYFYVNPWSKEKINFPETMPTLPGGKWGKGEWKGAYLSLSELLKEPSGNARYQLATSFFSTSIEKSLEFLS